MQFSSQFIKITTEECYNLDKYINFNGGTAANYTKHKYFFYLNIIWLLHLHEWILFALKIFDWLNRCIVLPTSKNRQKDIMIMPKDDLQMKTANYIQKQFCVIITSLTISQFLSIFQTKEASDIISNKIKNLRIILWY